MGMESFGNMLEDIEMTEAEKTIVQLRRLLYHLTTCKLDPEHIKDIKDMSTKLDEISNNVSMEGVLLRNRNKKQD